MVRNKPRHFEFKQTITIQPEILKQHPELPLHMNFCFINGHPYFTKITGKVNYRKIIRRRSRCTKEIMKRLQAIVAWNNKRSFKVNEYHKYNELKKIESDLVPSTLHTQVAGEHEPTSEQNIRTLKDRTRSTMHSVPYRKMTLLMIDYIVGQAQYMLNVLTYKKLISTTISERNIIQGRSNLDYNTMSHNLGEYVQLIEGTKNTQCSSSVGAVAIKSSNKTGGYYSMSLRTGRKLYGLYGHN